tara:strand:- start:4038 stop:4544 length:507 start_codon:yes stop_codon:yes gene_type:complete
MKAERIVNLVGALSGAIADDIVRETAALLPPSIPPAAIALVGHAPWVTVAELASALHLSSSATVRLVDRAVEAGFFVRRPSEVDRRISLVELTEAGRAIETHIVAVRRQAVQRSLDGLSSSDKDRLGELAERMLGQLVRNPGHAVRVCRMCEPQVCADCPVEPMLPPR